MRVRTSAYPASRRYAALARLHPSKGQPVKKILLLVVVIALGAVIAAKVRSS